MKFSFTILTIIFISSCQIKETMEDFTYITAPRLTSPPTLSWPNTEPLQRKMVSIKVPSGYKNLAFDKEVLSSDEDPIIGDLSMLTDGDLDPHEYLQLKPNKQWIQIDLEKQYSIYVINIWFKRWEIMKDVIVQISNDIAFKKDVKTIFNNDLDNSSNFGKGNNLQFIDTHFGKTIQTNSTGQYIRIYSNGNCMNRNNYFTEIEVYGK